MKIEYKNIVLRDMTEKDIDDDIRWNTVETDWADWDAPWEALPDLLTFDPEEYRKRSLRNLRSRRMRFAGDLKLIQRRGSISVRSIHI